MCLDLNSKNNVLLTASKDMVVYKFLRKKNGGFKTPYQETDVVIGETYFSDLIKYDRGFNCDMGFKCALIDTTIVAVIQKGLHSLKSPWAATNCANNKEFICKCIIPKGSLYYRGDFDGDVSFASDTLTYVKVYSKVGGFFKALSVTLRLSK